MPRFRPEFSYLTLVHAATRRLATLNNAIKELCSLSEESAHDSLIACVRHKSLTGNGLRVHCPFQRPINVPSQPRLVGTSGSHSPAQAPKTGSENGCTYGREVLQ